MQMQMKRKLGWQRSSGKIGFKTKNVKKRQRRALPNDKGIDPRIGYNNYKYVHTQHGSTYAYEPIGRNEQ